MPDALPAELMPAPFDPDAIPPEALDAQDEEPLPEAIERWEIGGTEEAEWAMRLLAAYLAEAQSIVDQANLYTEQVSRWEQQELRRVSRKEAFFRGHLERYALWWRQSTNRATLSLPSGAVKTSRRPPRIQIADAQAVMEWLERQGVGSPLMLACTKTTLSLSGIQDALVVEDRPTQVDLARSCGCMYRATPPLEEWTPDTSPCPSCGADSSVIQALVVESELVATAEPGGEPVPGLFVVPEHVTAKAAPA